MEFAARKIKLISWISNLREEKTLSKLEKIQKEEADWWDQLSQEEKEAIKKGLAEADNEELIPYEEILREVRAKYRPEK